MRVDGKLNPNSAIRDLIAACSSTANLAKHLENEGVSFLQFSFRWFHLLFLRVLPVNSVIRMWDTYMVGSTTHLIS